VVNDLLMKEIESYGTLKLTEKGKAFIEKPVSFCYLKEHDYTGDTVMRFIVPKGNNVRMRCCIKCCWISEKKFERKKYSAVCVFQEPSLQDMAIHYPITLEELTNIQGVGQGKASRYGPPFVELIARYVEENDIDRPQDFVMKSIVNKSGLKVQIIQNVDRKMPLDAIASSQGKAAFRCD
jgi:ATP-dependent DNA helicase RecQ